MRFRMKPDVGEHYFDVDGTARTLKPGDIIDCDAKALGNAIDKFQRIDGDEPPVNRLIVADAGGGKYNVLHPVTGKPINSTPLTRTQAEALAAKSVPYPTPPAHFPPRFTLVEPTPGWFDVIHPVTGEPINDSRLRKPEAEKLARQTVAEWDAAEAERLGR